MPETANTATDSDDGLKEFLHTPLHLFIRDKLLADQMGVILAILGFSNVKSHPTTGGYLDNVRRLAQLLSREEGVFLVKPPLTVLTDGGRKRITKSFADFFQDLTLVLGKSKRDVVKRISKCVPVFPDIQMVQKREQVILSLARFGVCGAFILKPQEPLKGMAPSLQKVRMKEQVMARMEEVREYLTEYLPHMDGALERLIKKKEEIELNQIKAKADQMLKDAMQAKAEGNYEHAIECLKKAIDLLPEDPEAYMESGRLYVHILKYTRALLRFNQAGEVSDTIPEPNKEIGCVRILQVDERLDRGESTTSPAVMELLEDAYDNFGTALKKATKLNPVRHPAANGEGGDSEEAVNLDAVSRIASSIVKLDLKTKLGKDHPIALKFGSMARDAFMQISGGSMDDLPPSQRIFLGLVAMDEKKFKEAEEHFFKAAEDPECFEEACAELTALGIHVRRQDGVSRAIEVYKKLLQLSPPNSAAVNFNMATAYGMEKNVLESSGAIVQAVFIDPTLPENPMFYNNPPLNKNLDTILELFDKIEHYQSSLVPPQVLVKAVELQEKLQGYILTEQDKKAFQLINHTQQIMPEFFQREHVVASKIIMNFLAGKSKMLQELPNPKLAKFGKLLGHIWQQGKAVKFSKRLIAYSNFKVQALRALSEQGDEPMAANLFTKATVCHPEYVETPEFYVNEKLNALAATIYQRLENIDPGKIVF